MPSHDQILNQVNIYLTTIRGNIYPVVILPVAVDPGLTFHPLLSSASAFVGPSTTKQHIQFNAIQNSLLSTQHIVNTTVFSCMRRVEKGASRRQRLCRLVPYLHNLKIYDTQLLIGDNDLNNHNNNVLAMLLQSCKHKKTRNSCRIKYTSTVASKLKSSISSYFS